MRGHGDSLGEVMHRRGKRILLALLCLATMPMILRQYQVQEIFVALLALAVALVVVLLLVVAAQLFGRERMLRGSLGRTILALASRVQPMPR
jgi:hypothetical protein